MRTILARPDFIRRFDSVTAADVPIVGGKNASLGEMIGTLQSEGVRVPDGFATTAAAFRHFFRVLLPSRELRNESVDAGRRYVAAYVDVLHYVERLTVAPHGEDGPS